MIHHIISDGWSCHLVMEKISQYYQRIEQGLSLEEESKKIEYHQFATWQWQYFESKQAEAVRAYWCETFKDIPKPLTFIHCSKLSIPFLKGSKKSALHVFDVDGELTNQLKELAQEENCSLFVVLLAGFKLLLAAYSGRKDIIVSSPMLNRAQEEFENELGLFVNSLPIRTQLSGNPAGRIVLSRVRKSTLGVIAHQQTPSLQVLEWINKSEGISEKKIEKTKSQFLFNLVNMIKAEYELSEKIRAVAVSPFNQEDYEAGASHIVYANDLHFDIVEHSNHLTGILKYRTKLFSKDSVTQFADNYKIIIQRLAENAETSMTEVLKDIDLP